MSNIVLVILGLLGAAGGFTYLWNKAANARALLKAIKERKEIKLVVDEHKRINPRLNSDAEKAKKAEKNYRDYVERTADQPDGDSE